MIKSALLVIVLLGIVAGTFQFFGRYVINYQLNDASLTIVVFGFIKVMKIPYADIGDVREMTFKETLRPSLTTLRFGNRIFGNIILIERKAGLVRRVLITPDDPSDFISKIRARVTTLGR